ncbi:MAG: hypothetical protein NUV91_04140 [Candidatus Omnitrophica bacterium]|nr:hypothetical protein [Candidatus Omnitrophota bacterium]
MRSKLVKMMLLFLFLGGCAAGSKEKVLKVFFDGVPPSGGASHESLEGVKDGSSDALCQKETDAERPIAIEEKKVFVHYPYEDRDCSACHLSNSSQSLKEEVPALCFSCHDNFLEKMEKKHYPAEEGMCLECHNPHQSENEKLLTHKGRELCFSCHDQEDLFKVEPHNEIGDESCLTCHDPHGE